MQYVTKQCFCYVTFITWSVNTEGQQYREKAIYHKLKVSPGVECLLNKYSDFFPRQQLWLTSQYNNSESEVGQTE
jgi:hypothetical protein